VSDEAKGPEPVTGIDDPAALAGDMTEFLISRLGVPRGVFLGIPERVLTPEELRAASESFDKIARASRVAGVGLEEGVARISEYFKQLNLSDYVRELETARRRWESEEAGRIAAAGEYFRKGAAKFVAEVADATFSKKDQIPRLAFADWLAEQRGRAAEEAGQRWAAKHDRRVVGATYLPANAPTIGWITSSHPNRPHHLPLCFCLTDNPHPHPSDPDWKDGYWNQDTPEKAEWWFLKASARVWWGPGGEPVCRLADLGVKFWRYEVASGKHRHGGRTYRKGDVLVSDKPNLDLLFRNKFKRLDSPIRSEAEEHLRNLEPSFWRQFWQSVPVTTPPSEGDP
jgi:hypothetical protein